MVNHSVWFSQGMFHTNSIEGLLSSIKRFSNNFASINFKMLDELDQNGANPKDYLDGWICFCLFIREIEKKNLMMIKLKSF
jgi:hypothetical protein